MKITLRNAALYNDIEMARDCVRRRGAKVNKRYADGRTPLFIATFQGHIDIVRFFVEECRANVNVQDKEGWSPLHLAVFLDHREIVRYLVNNAGARVNGVVSNIREETPLSMAVWWEWDETTRFLIREGRADVNTRDRHGRSPLDHVIKRDHVSMMEFIVREGGALIGGPPLKIAIRCRSHLTVVWLKKHLLLLGLTYLSIQKRGPLPVELIRLLGTYL